MYQNSLFSLFLIRGDGGSVGKVADFEVHVKNELNEWIDVDHNQIKILVSQSMKTVRPYPSTLSYFFHESGQG